MTAIVHGYQGFGMLISMNWDRILFLSATAGGLALGAFLGGQLS
jgi:hypothetical protein